MSCGLKTPDWKRTTLLPGDRIVFSKSGQSWQYEFFRGKARLILPRGEVQFLDKELQPEDASFLRTDDFSLSSFADFIARLSGVDVLRSGLEENIRAAAVKDGIARTGDVVIKFMKCPHHPHRKRNE